MIMKDANCCDEDDARKTKLNLGYLVYPTGFLPTNTPERDTYPETNKRLPRIRL